MPRVANFTVTIQPIPQEALSVSFATRDGTAVADVDYVPTTGTTVFQPGTQSKIVPVAINDEAVNGKRFYLDVSWVDPSNKVVVRPTGTCIIGDATVLGQNPDDTVLRVDELSTNK